MSVCGHIGVAFDPLDEALAISAVNGQDCGSEWVRYKTSFGLTGSDYWTVHLVLQQLAMANPSLQPVSTTIIGTRAVGEGPTYPMCLYLAEEVAMMSAAFNQTSDNQIYQAIQAIEKQSSGADRDLRSAVTGAYRRIGRELDTVGSNGWSLIAFMF